MLAQTFKDFEIIFLDNASTDNSLEIAGSFAEEAVLNIRIVKTSENYGFCKGNNIAFSHSKGKYVVLLNNDTYVSSTWLEDLVRTMDSDSSIGICQSKIIDLRQERVVYGHFVGVYGKKPDNALFKTAGDLFEGAFYASGAALIIRRVIVEKLDYLFDDEQFTGDMDLSWRVRLMGFRIVTNLRALCYHYQGHSSKLVLRNEVNVGYVVFRDQLQTFIKNYALSSLFSRMAILLSIDSVNSIYMSIKSRSLVLYSLPKAIFWNLCNLKNTWSKHVKTQSKRRVTDSEIEHYMLPYPSELYFIRLKIH